MSVYSLYLFQLTDGFHATGNSEENCLEKPQTARAIKHQREARPSTVAVS